MATAQSKLQIIIDVLTGDSKRQVSQLEQNLMGIGKTLAIATAGVTAFGLAAKKAFELGKEGAEILLIRERFDRLAKSIGTTGDALMRDLGPAMGNMLSKTEQMAAATDLMALGLVKNHDEAIRLARVAGQLDMNMNQLVLTLTNQTTMRFDALGVSVDGFNEKVKALEETGMSAGEAFTEAFLQQAEEQLERVGSAADSTLGNFKQLEAETKNLTDEFKILAGEALAPTVKGMAAGLQASRLLEDAIGEGLVSSAEAASWRFRDASEIIEEINKRMANYNDTVNSAPDYIDRMVQSQQKAVEVGSELEVITGRLAAQIYDVNKAALGKAAIDALNQAYEEGSIDAATYHNELGNLMVGMLDMSAQSVLTTIKMQDLKAELDAGNITAVQYANAVKTLYDRLKAMDGLVVRSTLYVDVNQTGTIKTPTGGFVDPGTGSYYGGAPQYQHGGSYVIPPGYNENYNMGRASSGERVSITPRQGNTYNQTWNVYTNGGKQAYERDYNMMRALAR